MKSLFILLFYLCVINVQPSVNYDASRATYHHQNTDSQNNPLQSAVLIQLPFGHPYQTQSQHENNLSAKDDERWIRWGVYVNGILVLATLVLAITAVYQAKAAKASVQAVVKSERAWILVEKVGLEYLVPIEVQQNQPNYVSIDFRNYGKTIAKMTAWKFGLYITEIVDEPPAIAYEIDKDIFNSSIQPPKEPVPQIAQLMGKEAIIHQADYDAIIGKTDVTKFLWLCGIIKYEDVFDPKTEHETLVCYRFGTWRSGKEPFFKMVVAKYNKET
jgi:hypothetical protein